LEKKRHGEFQLPEGPRRAKNSWLNLTGNSDTLEDAGASPWSKREEVGNSGGGNGGYAAKEVRISCAFKTLVTSRRSHALSRKGEGKTTIIDLKVSASGETFKSPQIPTAGGKEKGESRKKGSGNKQQELRASFDRYTRLEYLPDRYIRAEGKKASEKLRSHFTDSKICHLNRVLKSEGDFGSIPKILRGKGGEKGEKSVRSTIRQYSGRELNRQLSDSTHLTSLEV